MNSTSFQFQCRVAQPLVVVEFELLRGVPREGGVDGYRHVGGVKVHEVPRCRCVEDLLEALDSKSGA